MVHPTEHPYIVKDDDILDGEPIIKGTITTVREVAEVWRTGIRSDEVPARMPHLTPAQVYSALAYFSDHQDEIMERIIYYRRQALDEKKQGMKREKEQVR